MSPKAGFHRTSNGYKENAQDEERKEKQYDSTIIECNLIFHAMVLLEKYTLLMSEKHKYCY